MSEPNQNQPPAHDEPNKPNVGIDEIVVALRHVAGQMMSQQKEIERLHRRFEERTPEPPQSTPPSRRPLPEDDTTDLEHMSNTELVAHVLKQVQEKVVEPVGQMFNQRDAQGERARLTNEIESLRSKPSEYGDFEAQLDTIKEIRKDSPSLSLEEALQLARRRNPEGSREFFEASERRRAEEEDKKRQETQAQFGGLLPTSGRNVSSDRMKPGEASAKAWEEVMTPFEGAGVVN